METKHRFTLFFIIALTVLSFSAFSQKQLIKVNGFDTNVYTIGLSNREPEEPVLVFENGWGMDLNNWKGIAEGLSVSMPQKNKNFQPPTYHLTQAILAFYNILTIFAFR